MLLSILEFIMRFFGEIIFFYMLLVVVSYSIMLLFATIELRKKYKLNRTEIEEDYIDVLYTKPVSIIVPAFNEEVGVVESIHALLSLRYPLTEIIVVNDGSTDLTQEKVIEQFKMKKVNKIVREQLPTKKFYQYIVLRSIRTYY